jgi:hypothetical protein
MKDLEGCDIFVTVEQSIKIIEMYLNLDKNVSDLPTELMYVHKDFVKRFAEVAINCLINIKFLTSLIYSQTTNTDDNIN